MNQEQIPWARRVEAIEAERRRRTATSPRRTAQMLRRDFPQVAEATIAEAELALKGMRILPGTGGEPAFVGDPPAWSQMRHNDAEYLWQLNRMTHWLALIRAWAITGEERFAAKVAAELDDWIANVPVPAATPGDASAVQQHFNARTPWRALEVGIRMYLTWPYVARLLAGTKWFDGGRAERFAASVEQHAGVLSECSPILWPKADHNHYMMEMLGLLYAGLTLFDHPQAPAWRDQATRELVRCCENQFTPGGGQIEGCPHYHIVCLDVIARAVGGLREYGLEVPPRLLAHMREGVAYMLQTTRPNGQIVPWGDSDPHTSTPAAVMAMWALGEADPLRLLQRLAGEEDVRRHVADWAWVVGDIGQMLAEARKAPQTLPPTVAWLKGLDQAVARTSWEREAAFVFLACRSPVNNGHAHIDPAGFDYTALGKPLLIDPGRYTYREGNDRYRYKMAMAHNTLTIDGREPFTYRSSWAFSPMKRGVMVSVAQQDGRATLTCEQENYAPILHRRVVILLPDGVLIVVDRLANLPAGVAVQRWFHFDSTSLRWDPQTLSATTADEVNAALFSTPGVTGELLAGHVSTKVDIEHASQRLCLEGTGDAAAVIVPFRGGAEPRVTDVDLTERTIRFTRDGHRVELAAE